MAIDKIASPQELTSEIRRVLGYCSTNQPSRVRIAEMLTELAERVATDPTAMVFPTDKAMKKYLEKHPKANPHNHSVRKGPASKPGPAKSDAGHGHESDEDKANRYKREWDADQKERSKHPPKPISPRDLQMDRQRGLTDSPDGRELIDLFRSIDQRKTNLPGLENSRRLIDVYHTPGSEISKRWKEVLDKAIDEARKNPKPITHSR